MCEPLVFYCYVYSWCPKLSASYRLRQISGFYHQGETLYHAPNCRDRSEKTRFFFWLTSNNCNKQFIMTVVFAWNHSMFRATWHCITVCIANLRILAIKKNYFNFQHWKKNSPSMHHILRNNAVCFTYRLFWCSKSLDSKYFCCWVE